MLATLEPEPVEYLQFVSSYNLLVSFSNFTGQLTTWSLARAGTQAQVTLDVEY